MSDRRAEMDDREERDAGMEAWIRANSDLHERYFWPRVYKKAREVDAALAAAEARAEKAEAERDGACADASHCSAEANVRINELEARACALREAARETRGALASIDAEKHGGEMCKSTAELVARTGEVIEADAPACTHAAERDAALARVRAEGRMEMLRGMFCRKHYDRYSGVELPMRWCRHDGCERDTLALAALAQSGEAER